MAFVFGRHKFNLHARSCREFRQDLNALNDGLWLRIALKPVFLKHQNGQAKYE
ncbi:hypothetical protein R8871_02519 [Paraburkholderia graminis C4D1M]|nr:hypothetical protein R8871_02519 [Paraburkholderia graminis C4D1M]